MTLGKVVRGFGKTSISAGVLILLFVAYQLWGTGIAEARSQRKLKADFPTVTARTPPAAAAAAPPAPPDAAVALLDIPKIGVHVAVVEGVGVDDLKRGPGHYPTTAALGHSGNAAIAGHRTTYGAPFYRLDELKPGDKILVTTRTAATPFEYHVVSSTSVDPGDTAVLDPSTDNRLTLTTCTPRFTATKRLIVVADLASAVDPTPVAPPPPAQAATGGIPGDSPGSLSGGTTSRWPGIVWALICAAVWAGAWVIGRRWRRWVVYAVATPVFLACLFVFFENTARFVPANI